MIMDAALFQQDAAVVTTVRGTLLVGWGDRSEYSIPPDNDAPAFYLNDFFLTKPKPWVQFSQWSELDRMPLSLTQSKLSINWKLPKQEDFTSAVADVMQSIFAGRFNKAVPYISGELDLPIDSQYRNHMLSHACNYARDFHGYAYAYWKGEEGMIGASPEQIFIVRDKTLYTVACAGTSSTKHPSDYEKILHEHTLVVDGLKHALSDFKDVSTSASYWKQAGNEMFHLTTPLQAESEELPSFDELIRRLHPTASIGCYPKSQGEPWLKQYDQKIPRTYYGAPIGYRWPDKNEEAAYVAIRNVQWLGDKLKVLAGCGVVKSSDPLSEWYEWNAKFNAVRSSIGL
ncbi:MAG: chorismate-binding protein [Parachlamydiales bacterium]|jgi:isochorismate synthase EntC